MGSTETEIERWSPFKSWLYSLFYGSPTSNVAVIEFARPGEGTRLLDIGCGPGSALKEAVSTGAVVAGVDPSLSMVDRAARRVPEAEVKLGSAEEIPFADDSFDVVISISSFHHWANREAGLAEILRVLAPGGRLHVVEGLLGEGQDGHGLSPADAQSVSAKLEELGYRDTAINQVKTGWRRRHLIVTGVSP